MKISESTQAFIAGLLLGFFIAGVLITTFVTEPRQKEAIKRGYAEMKLPSPTSTTAVFTWK